MHARQRSSQSKQRKCGNGALGQQLCLNRLVVGGPRQGLSNKLQANVGDNLTSISTQQGKNATGRTKRQLLRRG